MKAIIFSDLHVHLYKAFADGYSRLNNTLKVIRIIYAYADKKGIDIILFPGDLYDNPKLLPTAAVNMLISTFLEMEKKYPKIKFIAISGNHDHATKNLVNACAITALTHLHDVCTNFTLLDNQVIRLGSNVYIHGVPYYEYPEHYHTMLKERAELITVEDHTVHLLMMHQTPSNMGNDSIPVDTDINDPLYDKFDYVFDGHIHKHMQLSEKFVVVGSPIHRSLEDEGVDKGFLVMDLTSPKDGYTFISLNKKFPEFKRRVVGTLLEEGEENDYIVWSQPVTESMAEVNASVEQFQAGLSREELLENYWKAVEGKDKELLTVGLKFI